MNNKNLQDNAKADEFMVCLILLAIGLVVFIWINGLVMGERIQGRGSVEVATSVGSSLLGLFAASLATIVAVRLISTAPEWQIWPSKMSKKLRSILCGAVLWLAFLVIAECWFRHAPKRNLTEFRTGDIIVTTAAPNFRWESPVTEGGEGYALLLGINAFEIAVFVTPLLSLLVFRPKDIKKFFKDWEDQTSR
jgi:hypothetical protein